MHTSLLVLALLAIATVAAGQSGFGSCQEPPVQQNFDASRYLGVWYEITKLPFFQEDGGFCITANYTLKPDGHINVDNRLHSGSVNGPLDKANGDAYAPDASQPAKLAVTFPGAPFAAPYWVLSTDYTSYTMIFSCTNILGYRLEYAWILSRTPTISSSLKQTLLAKFKSFGLNPADFVDTVQTGCKYY